MKKVLSHLGQGLYLKATVNSHVYSSAPVPPSWPPCCALQKSLSLNGACRLFGHLYARWPPYNWTAQQGLKGFPLLVHWWKARPSGERSGLHPLAVSIAYAALAYLYDATKRP